ncbi:RNA 3'-terminal phosphate cyclase [Methanopyrus kandleri]
MSLIEIDGSYGEGGGQILRTAVGMSALTSEPVRIYNIRANRPRPGLSYQHLHAVKVVAEICDAECEGLEVGSTEIVFEPGKAKGGEYEVDIGTAGSVTLLLQAVKLAAIAADGPVEMEVRGGTDVKWSPPVDYEINVNAHYLDRLGYRYELEVLRRGHYPRGGGIVRARMEPPKRLKPLEAVKFGELESVRGISHCVRLPPHVAERQAKAASEIIERELGIRPEIEIETYPKGRDPHLGPGSGIVLWAEDDQGNRIGADALGEKGKPAEVVGREAAEQLVQRLRTGMALDEHMGDQILPFLAIADGESVFGVTGVDPHLPTNAWVVEKFLPVSVEIRGKEGEPATVEVRPEG